MSIWGDARPNKPTFHIHSYLCTTTFTFYFQAGTVWKGLGAHQYVFWGFDPVRTLKDASVKLLVSPPPDEGTGAGNPQPPTSTPNPQTSLWKNCQLYIGGLPPTRPSKKPLIVLRRASNSRHSCQKMMMAIPRCRLQAPHRTCPDHPPPAWIIIQTLQGQFGLWQRKW